MRTRSTFGRRWGSAAGTTPVVVTVHPGQAPLGPGRTDAEWNAYQREEAEALLAEARALLGDGAEYRSVDASSPAHGLSDLVEAGDCVLVLGARRARGLRRTYPGSNAQRLLHGSASPVTIVPSDYAEREDTGFRRVTVAYLDTPDGQAALSAGARFARPARRRPRGADRGAGHPPPRRRTVALRHRAAGRLPAGAGPRGDRRGRRPRDGSSGRGPGRRHPRRHRCRIRPTCWSAAPATTVRSPGCCSAACPAGSCAIRACRSPWCHARADPPRCLSAARRLSPLSRPAHDSTG